MEFETTTFDHSKIALTNAVSKEAWSAQLQGSAAPSSVRIDACEAPQNFVQRETRRRNRVEMAEQWHYFKRIFWWGRLGEATSPLVMAENILKVVPFETRLHYRIKQY